MEALNTGKAFRDPSRPQRKRQPRKGKLNNMKMIIAIKVTYQLGQDIPVLALVAF